MSSLVTGSRPLPIIDSLYLCEYIVKHYGPMSHLKLQKLLYYCDAYHLAYFEQELITDEFEAWVHGPVSRKVFNSLRDISLLYSELKYQYAPGEVDVDKEFSKLKEDQRQLVTDVLNSLSKWTGYELENATHKELPWRITREGLGDADKCGRVIPKALVRDFYRKELYGK